MSIDCRAPHTQQWNDIISESYTISNVLCLRNDVYDHFHISSILLHLHCYIYTGYSSFLARRESVHSFVDVTL